jgi:hypothetical protein
VMCVMVLQTLKRPAAARNAPALRATTKPAPRPSRNAIAATSGH